MAAVGSETLYCWGECKSAILAYMAGIRREREGEFFFSPQYPLPFMNLPSELHPMKGNPDSGMRKTFACGIRNPENFACGIRNPGLWSPEYSLRNPVTIKIQNSSSSDRDWNPVPGILKSVTAWNRESQTVIDSRDIALQVLGSRSLVQPGADCWCSSVWLRISLNPDIGFFWTLFCPPIGMPCVCLLACKYSRLSSLETYLSRETSLAARSARGRVSLLSWNTRHFLEDRITDQSHPWIMKFYEKRHYSQKYVFSDALEEDYKLGSCRLC